jgi:hypothetical protein
MFDTSEPSIAAGSKVEIGGALYEFTGDEAGTGWAGIGVSNYVYMLLTPSGATVSWSYTTTAPTWDTAKQGWYTAANRVFGRLYKDAAGTGYIGKVMLFGSEALGDGTNLRLGRLWHLPLGNTTSRSLTTAAPPAASSWSGAITGAGVVGVPAGAKAVRARVEVMAYATAAGLETLLVSFSDNNSNTPNQATAHPLAIAKGYASGAGVYAESAIEIDIPLSAVCTFYIYTITASNITVASSNIYVIAMGFYLGE